MNSSQVYPSKFLKAEDLDEDIVVTIEAVAMEDVGTQKEPAQKPVLHFKETEKGMICNKTNWKQIAKQHGDESDDWTGKQITLTVMDVEFKNDIVAAIRVKIPKPVKAGIVTKPAAPVAASDPITAFWTAAKAAGYDRKDGMELLKSFDGDYAKALEGIQSGEPLF